MPTANAPAAGGMNNMSWSTIGMRVLFFFILYSIITGFQNKGPTTVVKDPVTGTTTTVPVQSKAPKKKVELLNCWNWDISYSMKSFLSETDILTLEESVAQEPLWAEDKLLYNVNETNKRNFEKNLTLSEDFINKNGSMWIHVFLTPTDPSLAATCSVQTRSNLVKWRAPPKISKEKSLLMKPEIDDAVNGALKEEVGEEEDEAERVSGVHVL